MQGLLEHDSNQGDATTQGSQAQEGMGCERYLTTIGSMKGFLITVCGGEVYSLVS